MNSIDGSISKISVSGQNADIYIKDMENPVLFVDELKRETVESRVTLSVANFAVCVIVLLSAVSAVPQKVDCNPPGRLVGVGEFRLHIFCTGARSSNPTVVLLHGRGDYSLDWALVQPEVARFTRVCSIDRAGTGWSDPGPPPRGPLTVAKELHSLLAKAKEIGPYVLVGHSWGGLIARVYAAQYAREVIGMVLVDPTHEDEYWEVNNHIVVPRLVSDAEWASMKPKGAAPRGERVVTKLNPPFDRLPSETQALRLCLMSRPVSAARIAGGDVQDMRQDLQEVYSLTRQPDGGYRVGDIPLAVLTRSPTGPGPLSLEKLKYNDQLQDDLAHASRMGSHIVASSSNHHIQLTEPDLVIEVIRKTVAAAAKLPKQRR